MKTNTLLGERIRELRKSRNLSQEQLAEKMDISSKYLSQIETGGKTPSVEALDRLATVLNVEMSDLFEFRHLDSAASVIEEINLLLISASEEQRRRSLKVIRALLI